MLIELDSQDLNVEQHVSTCGSLRQPSRAPKGNLAGSNRDPGGLLAYWLPGWLADWLGCEVGMEVEG